MSERDPASFYDTLAPLFDVMTDWESRLAAEGPFLRAVLEEAGARRVLDAACGSGGHALALAQWGYEVTGADVSAGMIDLARGKAETANVEVPFVVAGLEELPEKVGEAGFDAVLCLGIRCRTCLARRRCWPACSGMARVLKPGGLLVLQNLNYDLRWRTQPRFFAAQGGVHEGREVLVWRFADYEQAAAARARSRRPGRILFHIALFRKDAGWLEGRGAEHAAPTVVPRRSARWRSGSLNATLYDAYGSMTLPLTPFDPEGSGDLVVVAKLGKA